MFQTIEKQGGSGGPQWLSDHPNPGNRVKYITDEAAKLRVENPIRDTSAFDQVKAHLRAAAEGADHRGGDEIVRKQARPGHRAAARPATSNAPSSRYTTYTEGDLFQVSVPSNWRELPGNNAVTFAPAGAYGTINGQSVFTHGVEIGVSRNETHDLQTAADELIRSLSNGNPDLRHDSGYDRVSVGNRNGLHTVMSNRSEASGRPETIELFATQLRDGSLFYMIGVAPRDEAASSTRPCFAASPSSVRFTRLEPERQAEACPPEVQLLRRIENLVRDARRSSGCRNPAARERGAGRRARPRAG